MVRSTIQEDLYFRRWETNSDKNSTNTFLPAHVGYRSTLRQLYVLVLKFQASSVCYFTKDGVLRTLSDMVKHDDWEGLLEDIEKQDAAMCLAYDRLNDVRIEEEFEKLEHRHAQNLEALLSVSKDVSGIHSGVAGIWNDFTAFSRAVEETRRDRDRQSLLDWLSSVDPSTNYNSAREKHETGTGDWLVVGNKQFNTWKKTGNSFMWINGKGNIVSLNFCLMLLD